MTKKPTDIKHAIPAKEPSAADADAAQTAAADEMPPVLAELAAAQAKANDYWERLLRLQAELDNAQRRGERELISVHKFALEKFAKALLPIVDSLEMALQMPATQNLEAALFGITLTYKMFLDILEKQGIKQLNPVDEVFNPQQHEAVTTQAKADVAPNTITCVMQKGYTLHDRLIRPALVVVATA